MDVLGRLAAISDNKIVYVVWNYYDTSDLYLLLELDNPNADEHLVLKREEFHLLSPLEVIERVTEWK